MVDVMYVLFLFVQSLLSYCVNRSEPGGHHTMDSLNSFASYLSRARESQRWLQYWLNYYRDRHPGVCRYRWQGGGFFLCEQLLRAPTASALLQISLSLITIMVTSNIDWDPSIKEDVHLRQYGRIDIFALINCIYLQVICCVYNETIIEEEVICTLKQLQLHMNSALIIFIINGVAVLHFPTTMIQTLTVILKHRPHHHHQQQPKTISTQRIAIHANPVSSPYAMSAFLHTLTLEKLQLPNACWPYQD